MGPKLPTSIAVERDGRNEKIVRLIAGDRYRGSVTVLDQDPNCPQDQEQRGSAGKPLSDVSERDAIAMRYREQRVHHDEALSN